MSLDAAAIRNSERFANVLKRTEFYPPEKSRRYQKHLLGRLLRHARAEVPFYANHLKPLFNSNDEIRWEAWIDIPTISRKDIQTIGDDLFAKSMPREAGLTGFGQSSGSTGRPLKFRTNGLMSIMAKSIGERILDWHLVNKNSNAAFISDYKGEFQLPNGTSSTGWNLQVPGAPIHQLSLGYTVQEQAEWLNRVDAEILHTYPSNAAAIIEFYRISGHSPPFHTTITHGEPVSDAIRQKIVGNFEVNLIDRYGASEIGPISATCPIDHSVHHQFSEVCCVEVLHNSKNEIVTNGEGRLVVTSLYNYAMPIIRYENFDYVKIQSKPCICGRTLPTIQKIHGRQRNLFKFRNGIEKWPNMLFGEYGKHLPAQQVQFIQKSTELIEIRYVPDGSGRIPDHGKIESYMKEKFREAISIQLTPLDYIERLPSGKFEDCISLVK